MVIKGYCVFTVLQVRPPPPSCSTVRGCKLCDEEDCCSECDEGYIADGRDSCGCGMCVNDSLR